MDKAEIDRENTKRNRDREQAILQGDSEIAEAWFDQAAEYWKQAIALTPGNYIEAQNWKLDLAGLFVCLVRKEEDLMIMLRRNQNHTGDLEEISRKVFSAHFGQLSIIFLWLSGIDPTHIGPSAQVVWPIVGQEILNGDVGGGFRGIQITSGFFQIWRASGITSELQLYCTAIGALIFASLLLFAGWFHYHKAAPKLAWFQDVESMLNHHLAGLLGLGSLSWAGHQIHVSLPINQFLDAGVDPKEIPLPHEFILNRDLLAQLYPSFFSRGLDPITGGLWLSDIAHHHLAIAILFLIAGHMYRTNWGIGHGLKDILEAHKGLYEILTTSWHAQLSLNLAMLALQLLLDYDPTTRYKDLLDRVLRHRDAIISHLNWVCIFLGFHSFGLYIHNDTMSALGRPQICFRIPPYNYNPIFAQWIQNIHAGAPGVTAPGATTSTSLTWGGGELVAIGGKVALIFYSRLIPDKANSWLSLPCDGPGRGGTCQVSAWDHVFLGLFWMYNSISSDVWGTISDQGIVTHITGGNFGQSSITINGWLRDFLWAQASQVIHLMFLFSCRGYWQELIESIVWAHNKLKDVAVGVTHYLLGGIATTWAFFLARIIAVG
ncbi:hypothetical protein ACJX0J_004748 [Zea mays]